MNNIRWKQRFQNFERAYLKFTEITEIQNKSEYELMALIQAFKYTQELSRNVLKDYLYEKGFELTAPREVLKQAFQNEYIIDGEVWLEALNYRSKASHCYNQLLFDEVVTFIQEEFEPVATDFYETFKLKYRKEN